MSGQSELVGKGDRLQRLQEAFKYCANLQEYLQKSFGAYLIQRVSAARINYWLTDTNAVSLQVCFEAKPDLQSVLHFFRDDGVEMEMELAEGVGEVTFTDDHVENRYMFAPDFEGFTLVHRAGCGPRKGVESRGIRVTEPVPQALLETQVWRRRWKRKPNVAKKTAWLLSDGNWMR